GELEGTYYTLLTANDLDVRGQFADVSAEKFIAAVVYSPQRDLDLAWVRDRTEGLERVRGTLGRMAISRGRIDGITNSVHHLLAVRRQVKQRYEEERQE